MMAQVEHDGSGGGQRRRFASLRARRPVPAPVADGPSDEELLGYLEGTLAAGIHEAVERRLVRSRYALDRLFILRQALSDRD